MKLKAVLSIFFAIISSSLVMSQAKRAMNHIEKEKFEQAETLLYKSILKDSINAGEKYALSILYFSDKYLGFDVDSAYLYILQSLDDYQIMELKVKEKLKKDGIDSIIMVNQKSLLENYAFALAKQKDRQLDYDVYIKKFITSSKYDSAVWYRNLRAYEKVQKINTWEEYEKYMFDYPDAELYADAKTNYEKLIYEEKTNDGKITSFKNFLTDFPLTPYREIVEKEIFKISTGDHSIGSYEQFIDEYPESKSSKVASTRIYFKNSDIAFTGVAKTYLNVDSIQALLEREKEPLFITFKNPYYVFNSPSGYQIKLNVTKVLPEYLCRNVTDKLLLTTINSTTSIINKNGAIIFQIPGIEQIYDFGDGIITYRVNSQYGLIFSDGGEISKPVFDSVKLIQHQFIAYQRNKKWGLFSINGIEMTKPVFDEIDNAGVLIKLTSKNRFDLIPPNYLIPFLDGEENTFNFQYTDIELLSNDLIITYKDNEEGLITNELRPILNSANQEITVLENGILVQKENKYRILSREPLINPLDIFNSVDYNDQWLAIEGKNGWKIISQGDDRVVENSADSINILNSATIIIYKNDTTILYFSNNKKVLLPQNSNYTIFSSPPVQDKKPTDYYMIQDGDLKTLFNSSADTVILPEKYNSLSPIGNEYLVYTYKNKKGLLDSCGNSLLEPEYDGIANYNKGSITILDEGKLGLFNLSKEITIPAEYDRSLVFYNDSLLIAHKDGSFGIINSENEEFLPFKYSDISYFNDSVAWVSDSSTWHLMNIYTRNVILQNVLSFHHSLDAGEDYSLFTTTKGMGMVHSNNGMIINGTYTEIRNIGRLNEPFFYSELFVNEASLYIAIIYDAKGNIISRSAYTEEEYEKVICEE